MDVDLFGLQNTDQEEQRNILVRSEVEFIRNPRRTLFFSSFLGLELPYFLLFLLLTVLRGTRGLDTIGSFSF